jgi:hypothetical protein
VMSFSDDGIWNDEGVIFKIWEKYYKNNLVNIRGSLHTYNIEYTLEFILLICTATKFLIVINNLYWTPDGVNVKYIKFLY